MAMEKLRNHYHRIWCSLCESSLRSLPRLPASHKLLIRIQWAWCTQFWKDPASFSDLLREGGQAAPSTYTGGSWLPHSSAETQKWDAKWAASYSASLEAWNKETRRYYWQHWKGNTEARSLADRRVIRAHGVPQLQETCPPQQSAMPQLPDRLLLFPGKRLLTTTCPLFQQIPYTLQSSFTFIISFGCFNSPLLLVIILYVQGD